MCISRWQYLFKVKQMKCLDSCKSAVKLNVQQCPLPHLYFFFSFAALNLWCNAPGIHRGRKLEVSARKFRPA